ncbi:hypothetical protein KSF_103580 [Reticulibacter mediterranei]|uniref:histidine kinase n=1 Tax=Reticulibacter mediterranei TaxID=2778369 RepID=A0A8J3IXI5_9CHLR|nr:HAMP domain-containing sensor histidine kinase [Reticulibacter mediterranei]GHP00311.1 hypothetical protein KSF_103580 [Reticulibacter mediterranei]
MKRQNSSPRKRQPQRLYTQIAITFAVIGFIAIALNAVLVGALLKEYFVERQGNQMIMQTQALSQCCGEDAAFLLHTTPQTRTSLLEAALADSPHRYALLLDEHGNLVYASPQLAQNQLPTLLEHARSDLAHPGSSNQSWTWLNDQLITDTPLTTARDANQPHTIVGELLLGENQSLATTNWRRSLGLVMFAAGIAVVLVFFGAVIAAQRLAHPLHTMTLTAQAIAKGEYQRRVTPAGPYELHTLSLSFNHMVDTALEQQQAERDLIANVSHELAAPLSLIRGYAEALLDGIINDNAQRLRVLRTISAEATRLGRLSGDLLDLAMLETGQSTIYLESVPIAELLTALHDRFLPYAQQNNMQIHLDLVPNLPTITTDGSRLEQVLVNLITNALRYTPPGGTITIKATTGHREVCLMVVDTGKGIPADALSHIWERFYRIHEGNQPREKIKGSAGVGLGLAVCHNIVTLLGGRIDVTSTVGEGTTFIIHLSTTTHAG